MITTHSETLRVRHAPADVFELVAGVEQYPDFIPYLTSLRVLERVGEGDPGIFTAEAIVRYKVAKERFVTRVDANRDAQSIRVDLVEGPFKVLENDWRLTALDDGSTRIDFQLRFQFSNMVLGMLLRANKERAVRVLVNRFAAEAGRRYEKTGEWDFGDLRTIHTE
ncbi:type II toxin-antitoxin system RatA family toxin [Hyphobacterium sp.]|uniref:type II toxin-antitoxin system RatA family toxin n=1 Tax=Hyphobacterium sp. TaxID=2004662 RepID=UPI003BAD5082